MTRKILNLTNPGTSTLFGSEDLDYVNKYLTGTDQSSSDPVTIKTLTAFGSNKFCILSKSTGFKYIFEGQDIVADRIVKLPLMGSDGEIALSSSTSANDWGNNMQTFRDGFIRIANPAASRYYTLKTSAITNDYDITFPLITANDEFLLKNATQALLNKTFSDLTLSGLLKTTNLAIKQLDTNTIAVRNVGDTLYKNIKVDTINVDNLIEIKKLAGAPATPSTDKAYIYLDSGTETVKVIKDTGTTVDLETGGGGGGSGNLTALKPQFSNVRTGVWLGQSDLGGSGLLENYFKLVDEPGAVPSNSDGWGGRQWSITSSGTDAGLRGIDNSIKRRMNPYIEFLFSHDNNADDVDNKLWFGLFDSTSSSLDDSNAFDSHSGVALCKRSDGSTWIICHNDGSGTQVEGANIDASPDTNIHMFKLKYNSGTSQWQWAFDAGSFTAITSTDVPATDTLMNIVAFASQNDSTTRALRIIWIYLEVDTPAQPF